MIVDEKGYSTYNIGDLRREIKEESNKERYEEIFEIKCPRCGSMDTFEGFVDIGRGVKYLGYRVCNFCGFEFDGTTN